MRGNHQETPVVQCRGKQGYDPLSGIIQTMTQRLSKLAEYLYNNNFEMAVEYVQKSREGRRSTEESEEVQLLLAKAYFLNQRFPAALELAGQLKSSRSTKIVYEATFIEFKVNYVLGQVRTETFDPLIAKLKKEGGENLQRYLKEIEEVKQITSRRVESTALPNRSLLVGNERREFDKLLKEEDDRSIVMEGMPMFLISRTWYESWKEYSMTNDRSAMERRHPGPITQFDIVDHIYNIFFDSRSNKEYTNRFVFASADYEVLPKKCWAFLKERYGGIEVKRFNISFIDKPNEIMTEVHLKRIEIARYDPDKTLHKDYLWVQITKKENWEGLRNKLGLVWGNGDICYDDGRSNPQAVTETDILDEIDTVNKRYLYVNHSKEQSTKNIGKSEKCGNKKCTKIDDLKFCSCKTIKYCGMDCLKEDRKNHEKRCQVTLEDIKKQPVALKEFKLEEKDFGGKKGIVGLKNLGNTCYMNSGLQCLSNTRELTQFFMRDEFKKHINHSNNLGTKGNLACAYAELIREMWTGSSDSLPPVKLKKKIGEFATQFSGYGQQDSQQFISYLIDGLQQDLNLVQKKETFQVSDKIRTDEEMSEEREVNDAKRIQSFVRNLMVGQFKSTVICSACTKVSVVFDPFMLISLPIPAPREREFYFIPTLLDKGALKLTMDFASRTSLKGIAAEFTKAYNNNYYNEIKEGPREKLVEERLLFLTLNSEKFTITGFYEPIHKVMDISSSDILFFVQIPVVKKEEELLFCEYQTQGERTSYPRFVKYSKASGREGRQAVILESLKRGLDKSVIKEGTKLSYEEMVASQQPTGIKQFPFQCILVDYKKKLKLSTFMDGYHERFNRRICEENEESLSLYDCFSNFSTKQKLERQNTVYCNRCKDHKEASKQMQIYKTNKILVLAFKRFTRHRKITVPVSYPIDGLDIGPYLLSNKNKEPVIYDLYGVVNHHGSLYGGHYTAYCQNFLDRRWYQFNDSRVSQISKGDVVTPYSYVLFYKRREK